MMCMDPSTWPHSSLYSVISAPLLAGLWVVREKFCSTLALAHPSTQGEALLHWVRVTEKAGKHLKIIKIQPLEALGLKPEVCSKGF